MARKFARRTNVKTREGMLKEEARAFDKQVLMRREKGFVPDLRNLKKVDWFYNNPWREPGFARIQWLPVMNFIISEASESGKRVLEVGCGNGMLSLELARNGLHVNGIDISSKSIKVARAHEKKNRYKKNFGSLGYSCADFLSLEFSPGYFNSVVFFRTLHHFPDLKNIVKKLHRLLAPRGRLILCEPIRKRFSRKAAEFALILRTLLPTWEDYGSKLGTEPDEIAWKKKVDEIYREYVYEDEHHQSIMDGSTNFDTDILKAIKPYFNVKHLTYSDAFIDKLIGGLRGRSRFKLAGFLKALDDCMVKNKILPPTSITISATKKG